jgi:RecD/TraA family predicted helicase
LKEETDNGHCWIKFTTLINKAVKHLKIKAKEIEDILVQESSNNNYVVSGNMIYLKKCYDFELGIKNNVLRLLNSDKKYEVDDLDGIIKVVEDEQGFQFTGEQLKAINYAIKYNVTIINGKAGTGKTSVIKGVIKVLQKVEGLKYATCALSGKASQRIRESTGLDSYTIHRLFGYTPNFGWSFNELNNLDSDVIVLDEASMVNSELFYYVVRAIKDGAKLIIAGDIAQLEPIGVGNVLVDLLQSTLVPKADFTIVHRQARRSGILSNANKVREGRRFVPNNFYGHKRLGELEDLYMYSYKDGDSVFNRTINIAKKYKLQDKDIMDFQIIAPMKSRGVNCTQNINNACQKIFNQNPDDIDDIKKIVRKSSTLTEGDKVIQNGNNYNRGIFNGTIGVIKYINLDVKNKYGSLIGEIVIDFEGVGEVRYERSEAAQLDLAYAITVHKSQGSQWKFVVFALDYSSYILLSRQLVYTGMTRASEALFMTVELKALQYSIQTDKSNERNTFLKDLLCA